ncbi:class I tRNA ligase family protein [Micromonospora sp. STR1s_5]|nr:class I tRNA ligase family protein [Micromonospora sp. STR1s_5]
MIWTEEGVQGAWRFVQRVWRLVNEVAEAGQGNGEVGPESLRRAAHKALAAVQDDIEDLRFNRAVARIYELANAIGAELQSGTGASAAAREATRIMVQLVAPMMPHLARGMLAHARPQGSRRGGALAGGAARPPSGGHDHAPRAGQRQEARRRHGRTGCG